MPKNLSQYRYYNGLKGLFTNGCKKTLKLVQTAHNITQEKEVSEEELLDTFVMIVTLHLVQKEKGTGMIKEILCFSCDSKAMINNLL